MLFAFNYSTNIIKKPEIKKSQAIYFAKKFAYSLIL